MKVDRLCLTFYDSMDTVCGILQARILECVVFSFSRGSSQPRDQTQVSCIFYQLNHKGNPRTLEWVAYPSPEDLPDPEIEPVSPALQADSLPTELSGKPRHLKSCFYLWHYGKSIYLWISYKVGMRISYNICIIWNCNMFKPFFAKFTSSSFLITVKVMIELETRMPLLPPPFCPRSPL